MPNALTTTGLTTATQAELIASFTAAYQSIYGSSINLASNSPDGQMMMVYIQALLDAQELIAQVYSSFDPNQAIGVVLDQRVSINGIQRQAGTYTVTNITLVLSQSVNLYGLDQSLQQVFTVSDSAGNQWQLQTTNLGVGPGTVVLSFQAANPGQLYTVPNTITVPVTIILGVTSINNPTTYSTLGINEESDSALRLRRAQSVSLASQGYLAGLIAALENIPGVTTVNVEENTTGATNGDGVPGHSIWVIIGGSGSTSAIANVIYTKRNAGCGMYGSNSYTVTQLDGSSFVVYWGSVVSQTLFIKLTLASLNGTSNPNIAAIRSGLVTDLTPGVYGEVNVNAIATAVQAIDPNSVVTSAGIGLASTTATNSYLYPTAKNYQFAISSPNIILLPMILTPQTATVTHLTTQTFSGLGGFGALVYSISVNNSGGSINSSTGVYTAGSAGFIDTILVTDSLSNTATATVTVI